MVRAKLRLAISSLIGTRRAAAKAVLASSPSRLPVALKSSMSNFILGYTPFLVWFTLGNTGIVNKEQLTVMSLSSLTNSNNACRCSGIVLGLGSSQLALASHIKRIARLRSAYKLVSPEHTWGHINTHLVASVGTVVVADKSVLGTRVDVYILGQKTPNLSTVRYGHGIAVLLHDEYTSRNSCGNRLIELVVNINEMRLKLELQHFMVIPPLFLVYLLNISRHIFSNLARRVSLTPTCSMLNCKFGLLAKASDSRSSSSSYSSSSSSSTSALVSMVDASVEDASEDFAAPLFSLASASEDTLPARSSFRSAKVSSSISRRRPNHLSRETLAPTASRSLRRPSARASLAASIFSCSILAL